MAGLNLRSHPSLLVGQVNSVEADGSGRSRYCRVLCCVYHISLPYFVLLETFLAVDPTTGSKSTSEVGISNMSSPHFRKQA